MADLNEFGYGWVYDLSPEQLSKYIPDTTTIKQSTEKKLTKALDTKQAEKQKPSKGPSLDRRHIYYGDSDWLGFDDDLC